MNPGLKKEFPSSSPQPGPVRGKTSLKLNGIWQASPVKFHKSKSYASLQAFTAATGYEKHDRRVEYDIFINASPIERGRTYDRDAFDFRLEPGGAAVDAGVRLPNVNDDHTGDAPDLGALELGEDRPHYGPRAGHDG